jgi:hypothetical protein
MAFGYDRDDFGYEWGYEKTANYLEQEIGLLGDPESKGIVYKCQVPPPRDGGATPEPTTPRQPAAPAAPPPPKPAPPPAASSAEQQKEDEATIAGARGKAAPTGTSTPVTGTASSVKPAQPRAPGTLRPAQVPTGGIIAKSKIEEEFRGKLSSAGLNGHEVDLYLKRFPTDRKRDGLIKAEIASFDRQKPDVATLRNKIDQYEIKSTWESLLKRGASPKDALAYLEARGWKLQPGAKLDLKNPPKLEGRIGPNGPAALTPSDRGALAAQTEEITSAHFNFRGGSIQEDIRLRGDLKTYLSHFKTPDAKRDAEIILRQNDFIDDKGNPKRVWSTEEFADKLYGIPKGKPLPDLSKTQPRFFNKDTEKNFENIINTAAPKNFENFLKTSNPNALLNFEEAHKYLESLKNTDPASYAILKDKLAKKYNEINLKLLTHPQGPYKFTEGDAKGIIYSYGVDSANPDLEKSKSLVNRLTGPDAPHRDEVWARGVKFYRDQLPGELALIGLNGEEAAKKLAPYLGEEDNLPPGTIEGLAKDYTEIQKVKGDRIASETLARKFIEEGRFRAVPGEGSIAGDQAYLVRARTERKGKEDPQAQAALNRLHGSSLADKERQARKSAQQQELDLKKAADRRAEESLALEKEKHIDTKENARFSKKLQLADLKLKREEFDEKKRQNKIGIILEILKLIFPIFTSIIQNNLQAIHSLSAQVSQGGGRGGRRA